MHDSFSVVCDIIMISVSTRTNININQYNFETAFSGDNTTRIPEYTGRALGTVSCGFVVSNNWNNSNEKKRVTDLQCGNNNIMRLLIDSF